MDVLIISAAALVASLLTFFSGFGLGTLLTPVFALFFPIDIAVALTGVVHFLNNIFKLLLTGKCIDPKVSIKFGGTAIIGAFIGAYLLIHLPVQSLMTYQLNDHTFEITLIKIVVSVLMLFFALMEIVPAIKKIEFDPDKLYFGGLLSGFFGGLSGHQGALRSAFLVRYGLSKESFIATGIAIACFIDAVRIPVYFQKFNTNTISGNATVLIIAILSAFTGALVGNKLFKKTTITFVQYVVAVMLLVLSLALGMGII